MNFGNVFKSTGLWAFIAVASLACFGWQSYNHYQTNTKLIKANHAYIGVEKLWEEDARKAAELTLKTAHLERNIKQLEAVEARSKDDIKDYILAYYKTVAPVIAEEIALRIIEKSEEHNVPFVVLVAMAEAESQFNPFAISPLKKDPARGVMQVRFGQWEKKLGLTSKHQLHGISANINAGTRIMRMLLDENKGSMKRALWKYVGVVKNKSVGNAYVKRVYENMGRFTVFRSLANQKPAEEENVAKVDKVVPKPAKIVPATPEAFSHVKFVHKVTYNGETLGLIAKWYTGSVSNWKKILELNPGLVPEKMAIGASITIDSSWLKRNDRLTLAYVQTGGQ